MKTPSPLVFLLSFVAFFGISIYCTSFPARSTPMDNLLVAVTISFLNLAILTVPYFLSAGWKGVAYNIWFGIAFIPLTAVLLFFGQMILSRNDSILHIAGVLLMFGTVFSALWQLWSKLALPKQGFFTQSYGAALGMLYMIFILASSTLALIYSDSRNTPGNSWDLTPMLLYVHWHIPSAIIALLVAYCTSMIGVKLVGYMRK